LKRNQREEGVFRRQRVVRIDCAYSRKVVLINFPVRKP
jgi:hypothetical protein